MPNQYNTGPAIFQKCADPYCEKQVRRTPSQVMKGKALFCSNNCMYKGARKPRKYSPADIIWIIDNAPTMTQKDMADKFKTTVGAFKRMICIWRSMGYEIGKTKRPPPIRQVTLTATQKAWILKNYQSMNRKHMENETSIPAHIIRRFTDNMFKSGNIQPKTSKIMAKSNLNKDGRSNHRDRKPPTDGKKANMREVLPTRKIDLTGCIKVLFNDKNHTTFYAKDAEHEARIRKKYAHLEKPLAARL